MEFAWRFAGEAVGIDQDVQVGVYMTWFISLSIKYDPNIKTDKHYT